MELLLGSGATTRSKVFVFFDIHFFHVLVLPIELHRCSIRAGWIVPNGLCVFPNLYRPKRYAFLQGPLYESTRMCWQRRCENRYFGRCIVVVVVIIVVIGNSFGGLIDGVNKDWFRSNPKETPNPAARTVYDFSLWLSRAWKRAKTTQMYKN